MNLYYSNPFFAPLHSFRLLRTSLDGRKSGRFLLYILLLMCPLYKNLLMAQPSYKKQSNFLNANSYWAIPKSAGLDFSNGQLVATRTALGQVEGVSSVADPVTGKLLFYSDGKKCWNSKHEVMPNGDNLLGNPGSTMQGTCIVPVIDAPGQYYLFSLRGAGESKKTFPTLFYSLVDMRLDNGFGDIQSNRKNIVLSSDTLSESMIAIPGENCDVWLLVHTHIDPVFKAYHITKAGIDTTPIISIAGDQISGLYLPLQPQKTGAYDMGAMSVSSDRKFVTIHSMNPMQLIKGPSAGADLISGSVLCKFNPDNGTVSGGIIIGGKNEPLVSKSEFSPDNSKLYTSTLQVNSAGYTVLLKQYDITQYDSSAIAASVITIDTMESGITCIRLYRDTLYITEGLDATISTINHPNRTGAGCDYRPASISLSGNDKAFFLPNEVVYPLLPDTINTTIERLICHHWEDSIPLRPGYAGNSYTYEWDNGTRDSIRVIGSAGIYWVKYNDLCHFKVDTFKIRGAELTAVITADHFLLSTLATHASYQWLLDGDVIPGATNRSYAITSNGTYRVVVTNEYNCVDTADAYIVNNYTSIADLKWEEQVKIYPNPAVDKLYIQSPVSISVNILSMDGRLLKTMEDARSIDISSIARGTYILELKGKNAGNRRIIKFSKIQ